jgi:tetratricopeptide (TPR) repeat protein
VSNKKIKGKRSKEKFPPLPSREGMERVMADLTRFLEGRNFKNVDEANAFLEENVSGKGPLSRSVSRSPLERAQDLIYDAWDSATEGEAAELARRALTISPDCADAYNLLADVAAKSIEEKCDLYRHGVEAGERALGPDFFEENKGHFWGMLETRPYMRARQGLAECLWRLGKETEAIGHYETLLKLNPNDNQGIRDLLLACYLKRGDDAGAGRLYRQYCDDGAASFVWTKVLMEFRAGGPAAAVKALHAARKENPHVPKFLCGRKKMPRYLPDTYGWGDESEAVIYAANFSEAWLTNPAALTWLKAQAR